MLSPAVSCGNQLDYWFDIRKINIDSIPNLFDCTLLIRIVPDLFCCCKLNEIKELISSGLMENRKNSGYVWGIKFYIHNTNETTIALRPKKKSYAYFARVNLPLLDKKGVLKYFKKTKK